MSLSGVEEPTSLGRKLGREFVVTVEVHPPRGIDPSKTFAKLRTLLETTHVDAFNATDAPLAQARMSALAMSSLIQSQLGVEALMHVATRYRNLLALQGDILGAHAMGVRNVLVLMGDSPDIGDFPGSVTFSDVTSSALVRMIKRANLGEDLNGRALDQATSFTVGAMLSLDRANQDAEFASLERKVAAGADFILTQSVFDPEVIAHAHRALGGFPLPVIMGVLPLRSMRHAEFLHTRVPGMRIPEYARNAMAAAPDADQGSTGITLAKELIGAVYDKIAGVYVIPAFGRYQTVVEVLEGLPPWIPPQL